VWAARGTPYFGGPVKAQSAEVWGLMAWEMTGQGTRSIKRRTGKRSGKRGGLFPPQSKKEKKKPPSKTEERE
jgi:hypothetical protein